MSPHQPSNLIADSVGLEESTAPALVPTWVRPVFLIALFVIVFFGVRFAIRPINTFDFVNTQNAIRLTVAGGSPYGEPQYYLPPWSLPIVLPLLGQPVEVLLALDTAIFVTMLLDLGTPAALLLLLHPAFITLIASSNLEWLFVGPGLWLLYRRNKGAIRGVAWLFLLCKPQSSGIVLALDGLRAIRKRDYRAFVTAGLIGGLFLLRYPDFFSRLRQPFIWSITILSNYGLLAALAISIGVIGLRWRKRRDGWSIGLQLGPIAAPYMLEYGLMASIFTMRNAGWLRTAIYVVLSIGAAALFWNDFHVQEQIGALVMVLGAALLAPANPEPVLDQ